MLGIRVIPSLNVSKEVSVMGKRVDDVEFLALLNETASGMWDVLNYSFNKGSEYVVTFVSEADKAHKERVRVSHRMADTLMKFNQSMLKKASSHQAA